MGWSEKNLKYSDLFKNYTKLYYLFGWGEYHSWLGCFFLLCRFVRYAQYAHFKIHSEGDYYKLEIDGYEGNAGDSLNDPWYGSNNSPFSTYNRDNDRSSLNCASMLKVSEEHKLDVKQTKKHKSTLSEILFISLN